MDGKQRYRFIVQPDVPVFAYSSDESKNSACAVVTTKVERTAGVGANEVTEYLGHSHSHCSSSVPLEQYTFLAWFMRLFMIFSDGSSAEFGRRHSCHLGLSASRGNFGNRGSKPFSLSALLLQLFLLLHNIHINIIHTLHYTVLIHNCSILLASIAIPSSAWTSEA